MKERKQEKFPKQAVCSVYLRNIVMPPGSVLQESSRKERERAE